jgi:hypothetical protein
MIGVVVAAIIAAVAVALALVEATRSRPPEGWERALRGEVAAASSGDERAEAIDAALADLDGRLRAARGMGAAALRLAVLGALLGATLSVAVGAFELAVGAAILGAGGALSAASLGRRARAVEARARGRADEIAAELAGGKVGGPRRLDRRHRGR